MSKRKGESRAARLAGVREEELFVLVGECEREDRPLREMSLRLAGKGDLRRRKRGDVTTVNAAERHLKEYSPTRVAQFLKQRKYSRFEYLGFLVTVARDKGQQATVRMQAHEKLDRLIRIIAVTHPAVAKELVDGVGSGSGEPGGVVSPWARVMAGGGK